MFALQNNRPVSLFFFIFSVFLILVFSSQSSAVPAVPSTREISQPDGTKFKTRLKGDERLHWHETEDGYMIMKDSTTSWWHYAVRDDAKRIKMSEYRVGKVKPEQLDIKKGLRPLRKQSSDVSERDSGLKDPAQRNALSLPHTQNLLVIMVDFNNVAGTYTPESFQSLFFSSTTKSVAGYYDEVSYGKFHIVSASDTYGSSDGIVGWLRLNQNHPDCENASNSDNCYQNLVSSAILAAGQYVNFSSFDTNGDNTIASDELSIIIIVAGYEDSYGIAPGPGVWAHQSQLYSPLTLDGKSVSYYAMFGEKHFDHQATIGAMVHELGHLMLDFPDLYDTDYSSEGLRDFDVMAHGSWCKTIEDAYEGQTPVHPSAWTKEYAGFISPTVIANQKGVLIPAVSESSTVIKVPTQNANEYFLLENRYMTGYDAGLEGCLKVSQVAGGLAIWHVDKALLDGCIKWNNCNNNEKHKLVDLEEADGVQDLDTYNGASKLQDLFYAGNNSTFGDVTSPNNRFYDGISNGISVSNISSYGSTMTADINAFSGTPSVPTNQLLNSGFESGNVNWVQYSSGGYDIITQDSQYAFNGQWFGWMGGYNNATEYVYQDLTIPSTATQAYVQFWYYIGTTELSLAASDTIKIEVLNQVDNKVLKTIGTLSNLNATSSWIVSEQYDVSEFMGTNIRLRLYMKTNNTLTTSFMVDTVSLMVVGGTGAEMQAPTAAKSYTYAAVATPVLSSDPTAARPFAVGNIDSGTLGLRVGLLGFSKPVDVYLAISASYNPNIYMIKSDNSLQPVSKGLAKWRENTLGPIDTSLYGSISMSSLTAGTYYLYVVVTPAGNTSVYYLWTTSFVVQ